MIRDIFVGKAEGFWDYYNFHNFMVSRRGVNSVGRAGYSAREGIIETFHAEPEGVTVLYQRSEGGWLARVVAGGTNRSISNIERILHEEAKKYEARSTVTQ